MSKAQADLLRRILGAGRGRGPLPLPALRRNFELLLSKLPGPDGVRVEPTSVGGVAAEWVDSRRPEDAASDLILVHLHGGGFVVGSPASHRGLAARLSRASGARCLVVGYRLAPEHPFPAALVDAVAVLRALPALGSPPARTVLSGDSAGAGLAVLATTVLRDAGEPLPRRLVLLCPWADLEGTTPSLDVHVDDPMVDRAGVLRMAALYLSGASPSDPRASPLFADLHGLPPALVQVGGRDALRDDGLRLAALLDEAGVGVEVEEHPEVFHTFHLFAARLEEGVAAIHAVASHLSANP